VLKICCLKELLIKENSCSRMFLCESLIFFMNRQQMLSDFLKIKTYKDHQHDRKISKIITATIKKT
jgi:hypothetical protein